MHGCNADGSLNDADFSGPLPLIGLYIALFSLACAALMALDLFKGFRHRRLWFPSRFFPLNAATLTLLGVAVKLPLDLNTGMPGRWDQLAKLSGATLVCTVMGNIMPSLGVTDNLFSNTFALAILVITVVGNIVAQMSTGVIYIFQQEHAIVLSFMLVLLAITFASAIPVSTTKAYLEQRYNSIHRDLPEPDYDAITYETLKSSVDKYWLMAHTCSPQYVLGRSAACTASGAFCLLSALVLVEAAVKSFLQESLSFCSGNSDYKWSTGVVLVSQAVTVVVGTVAPAWRCLSAIRFREGNRWNIKELKVEEYWIKKLKEWKACPLPQGIRCRLLRKVMHRLRSLLLSLLIVEQCGIVVVCKLVRLISLSLAGCFVWWSTTRPTDTEAAMHRGFVLHLEGEDELVIVRSRYRDSQKLIRKGGKKPPAHLVALVKTHSSRGFAKVRDCGIIASTTEELRVRGIIPSTTKELRDCSIIPSTTEELRDCSIIASTTEELRNCWALPVVTLASIALAIPGVRKEEVKSLRRGVGEALKYVRLVHKNLDINGLVNAQEAADMLWETLDLYGRWLDRDLRWSPERNPSEIMQELKQFGAECIQQESDRGWNPMEVLVLDWPPRVLAAICMQSIAGSILQGGRGIDINSPEMLFKWLRGAIADILGACLTNLRRAIFLECFCSEVEVRERRVREAAVVLGESKNILLFLQQRWKKEDALYPPREQMASIDAWASPTTTTAGNGGDGSNVDGQYDHQHPSGPVADVEIGPVSTDLNRRTV